MLNLKRKDINATELQSKTIDFIRFPVSIGVVFIHNSYGGGFDFDNINYFQLTGSNVYDIFRLLTKTLATIATPYFFLISGFFYFKNIDCFDKKTYISKTSNRFKTLFIPYLVWNLLAFIVPLITSLIKGEYSEYISRFSHVNPLSIFWNINSWDNGFNTNLFGWKIGAKGPLNIPLWFLRDLFIISLISPLIHFMIKKLKLPFIILLGACFITKSFPSITGFSIISIFFFTLGAYFRINKLNLVLFARKHQIFVLTSVIIAIILDTIFINTYIQFIFIRQIYRLMGLFSVLIIGSYIYEYNIIKLTNRRIAKSSFFIYIAHGVSILGIIVTAYSKLFQPSSPIGLGLVYFMISITTVIICYYIYIVAKKILPKFMNIITGSR